MDGKFIEMYWKLLQTVCLRQSILAKEFIRIMDGVEVCWDHIPDSGGQR